MTPKSLPRKSPQTEEYTCIHVPLASRVMMSSYVMWPLESPLELSWDSESGKRKKGLSIIMKISLTLWAPWKSLRDPQGTRDHTLRTTGVLFWRKHQGTELYIKSGVYFFHLCFRLKRNWNDEWNLLKADVIKCFQ